MFSTPSIQSTFTAFNGNSFGVFFGFGMYSSPDTVYYYVMDTGVSKVFILNDNGSFISYKVFTLPCYMISIDNSLYITGYMNVWLVDQNLNILINSNPGTYPWYMGISYNPSNITYYYMLLQISLMRFKFSIGIFP